MRKATMKRSQLQTKYFKKKTPETLRKFKKQKNYCSNLYKRERKKYYQNLNLSEINVNKQFWRIVKPLFTDEGKFGNINLQSDKGIIIDDKEVAQQLNNFFENATNSLEIIENPYIGEDTSQISE